MDEINGYNLSRSWFDWCFENPEKITPNHTALYFFIIEHCNRLGWKKKFGLPTTMAMEAIGIKSYNTYIKTFREIIDFGFINLIQKSTNQYSANIIELSNIDKAPDKALDKAMMKHLTKQVGSTSESISSIDKHITYNIKPITSNNKSKPKYNFKKALIDYGFKEELVNEWLLVRERKKSLNTEMVFKNFIKEVEKVRDIEKNDLLNIIAVERQWAGFSHVWMDNLNNANGTKKNTKVKDVNDKWTKDVSQIWEE